MKSSKKDLAVKAKAKDSLAEEFDSELHRRLYRALGISDNPTLEQRVNGLEYGMMDVLTALGNVRELLDITYRSVKVTADALENIWVQLMPMQGYLESINRVPSRRRPRKKAGR